MYRPRGCNKTRNRALVACYMSIELRFKEVLNLHVGDVDRIRGDVMVTVKGGNVRPARLSQRALKYLREYLRLRPGADTDRLWLQAKGQPLGYWGAQEMFRKLSVGPVAVNRVGPPGRTGQAC